MKIRTDNRYAYAAILLTVCLVVAKLMGWFPISWFVALLPVLFPFLLIGALALVLVLFIAFAFLFGKTPKQEASEPESNTIYFNDED